MALGGVVIYSLGDLLVVMRLDSVLLIRAFPQTLANLCFMGMRL